MPDLRSFDFTDRKVLEVIEEIKRADSDGVCRITPKDLLIKLNEHNVVVDLETLGGSIQFLILKGVIKISLEWGSGGSVLLFLATV